MTFSNLAKRLLVASAKQMLAAEPKRYAAIAFFALVALGGCGPEATPLIKSPDAEVPDADIAAAGADAGCEIISYAYIKGLTSPVWHGVLPVPDDIPDDPDPDRFTIVYNGEPAPRTHGFFGVRMEYLHECTGHATVELSHTVSGEFIGREEWDVIDVTSTFDDWISLMSVSNGRAPELPDITLVAFGEAHAYSTKAVHMQWGPPVADKGLWRFHVFNGLLNDNLTARLVSGDIVRDKYDVVPDGLVQIAVVTNMAPKSVDIVEADHLRWHDDYEYGVAPQKAMALELFRGSSADPDKLLQRYPLIYPLMEFDAYERLGLAPGTMLSLPDGMVTTVGVNPEGQFWGYGISFLCRDPMYASIFGASDTYPTPCPED
jgi:hypothetical protein